MSAVALATSLSHSNEADRGRRPVLKEKEAHRCGGVLRRLGRSSAPSELSPEFLRTAVEALG